MKEKHIKILHLVYGTVLSLLIVAFALLTIGCCVLINSSSDNGAYTLRSLIVMALVLIVPFSACVNAIIGGGILHAIFPQEKKVTSNISTKNVLKNLYKRVHLRTSPKYLVKVVRSQRGFRYTLLSVVISNIVVCVIGAIIALFFSGIFKDVDAGYLPSVIPAILSVLAFAILPFISVVVYKVFAGFTYERELEAVSEIVKHNTKNNIVVSKKQMSEKTKKTLRIIKRVSIICLQVFIVLAAITFIVLGIIFDSKVDETGVFRICYNLWIKAKNICSECIGLG